MHSTFRGLNRIFRNQTFLFDKVYWFLSRGCYVLYLTVATALPHTLVQILQLSTELSWCNWKARAGNDPFGMCGTCIPGHYAWCTLELGVRRHLAEYVRYFCFSTCAWNHFDQVHLKKDQAVISRIIIHPHSGWYFSFWHSPNTIGGAQVRFLLAYQPCNCYEPTLKRD